MDKIIGIDLGTTNSVVSIFENGSPTVLLNAEGSPSTPSVVLYPNDKGDILVGELARRQQVLRAGRVVRSVKRFMGRHYSELTPELMSIGVNVKEGPNDSVLLELDGLTVTPEQVSSEILKKMKDTAVSYLGEDVLRAVITVPAYFNDTQRQATVAAAKMAGLQVARIINEPTAAALAYSIDAKKHQRIVVFDLGGGTLDVSILQLSDDVVEVLATRGDTYLGGDNFDEVLCKYVCERFQRQNGIDLTQDLQAMQRLMEAIEVCKCELSTVQETVLSLPFISINEKGLIHLNQTITRDEFESLISCFMTRMKECCHQALDDAGLTPGDIEVILPIGGSSRIPLIRNFITDLFGREPLTTVDPESSVAMGAAVQGSVLSGALREVLLLDVTPLSLGIEVSGGVFSVLIPRNSSIPVVCTRKFTTVRDNQRSVKVHVLQGERRIAKENHTLGIFSLEGIAPAPREIPEIEVSFQIDSNGILNVSAVDTTSGVKSSITIVSFGVVDLEEAQEIAAEAEAQTAADMAFLQVVKVRAKGDVHANELRSYLETFDLPEDLRKETTEMIFKYDVASVANDIDEMEERIIGMMRLLSRFEESRLVKKNLKKI
ncbi:MAG: molecular chaperone DnaK [Candidatus Sumerlaeales bacterium]|nr:molecular chaperone DnaK [Candidatus Sumerlaeales bacterium]